MIIAIDFDGTIVTHEYPRIGKPVPYAIDCLQLLQDAGNSLILYTMRSGKELQQAVDYCESCDITFWGVNDNPDQKKWTDSRKVYAHMYIDDSAYGVPLIYPDEDSSAYVDWSYMYRELTDKELFDEN